MVHFQEFFEQKLRVDLVLHIYRELVQQIIVLLRTYGQVRVVLPPI